MLVRDKKASIVLLILSLCIVLFVIVWLIAPETVCLNFGKTDEIKEIWVRPFQIQNSDEDNFVYTDYEKIKSIIEYFQSVKLKETSKSELPNQSPDGVVQVYDDEQNRIWEIWLYGEVFLEDCSAGKVYRVKHKSDGLIKGLIELDASFG